MQGWQKIVAVLCKLKIFMTLAVFQVGFVFREKSYIFIFSNAACFPSDEKLWVDASSESVVGVLSETSYKSQRILLLVLAIN